MGSEMCIRDSLISNNDFSIAGSFDSFVSERTQNIELLAAKYGLTFTEEIHAQYAGRNLKSEQIELATQAIYNRQDDLGYYGETTMGLYGFTNQPNVHQFALPADGGGGNTYWNGLNAKTPEQIIRDMQQLVYSTSRRTRWAYHTTHIAIPPEVWEVLAFTILTGLNSTSTILAAFLTNQQVLGGGHGKVEIVLAPGLSNAGINGEPLIVCYNPDPRHLGILETPGIDARPNVTTVTGTDGLFYKYVGGIALLQPLSMTYINGSIDPATL